MAAPSASAPGPAPERAGTPGGAPAEPKRARSRRIPFFAFNVGAILIAGVGISAWYLRYTELFPEIGGVLALGGLASWLAFVSKVLSEERQEAFQRWVDEKVLSRGTTSVLVLAGAAAFVAWASFRGTVSVESLSGEGQRVVWIHAPGEGPGEPEHIPPAGVLRTNVAARPGVARPYVVKVAGFPDLEVPVRPWRITRLYVPTSFVRRPVMVLRPDPMLVPFARANQPMELRGEVRRRDGTRVALSAPFDGHALWVGCDEDVEVPPSLQLAWEAELAALGGRPTLARFWTEPRQLAAPERLDLRAGDEISVQLWLRGNPYTTVPQVIPVSPVSSKAGFIQSEVIRGP